MTSRCPSAEAESRKPGRSISSTTMSLSAVNLCTRNHRIVCLTASSPTNVFFMCADGSLWQFCNSKLRKLFQFHIKFFTGGIAFGQLGNTSYLFITHTCENKLFRWNFATRTMEPHTCWLELMTLSVPIPITANNNHHVVVGNRDSLVEIEDCSYHHLKGSTEYPIALACAMDLIYVCKRADNFVYACKYVALNSCTRIPIAFDRPKSLCMYKQDQLLVLDRKGLHRVNLKDYKQKKTLMRGSATCVYVADEKIFVSVENRLVEIAESWKTDRILWIGQRKNNTGKCHWSRLPRDMVKHILSYIHGRF